MASADQPDEGRGGDGGAVSPERRGEAPVEPSGSVAREQADDALPDASETHRSGTVGRASEASPERGRDAGVGVGVSNGTEVDSSRENSRRQNYEEPPSCEPADGAQALSDESRTPPSTTPNDGPRKRRGRPPRNRSRARKRPTPAKPVAPCPGTTVENSPGTPPKTVKKRGRKSRAELLALAEQGGTPTQNPTQGSEQPASAGRPKRRAATAAREYLQSLVNELEGFSKERPAEDGTPDVPSQQSGQTRKRKRIGMDQESDDPNADADFVPDNKEVAESEEDPSEDGSFYGSDEELRGASFHSTPHSTKLKYHGYAANGLHNSIMAPVWCCTHTTKAFREENLSSWVFPEWIPSAKDWHFLSGSEAEKYLPQEEISPTFRISREGLKEESSFHRVPRFGSLAVHPDRWDTVFFVGGPVWSMEWCPCPDGATDHQYAAIYCHQGMDIRHKAAETYSEPTLLQVWDLGELLYDTRPSKQPTLAYALATDDGCIWDMKWCPSGAWELPLTCRKAPLMPRLGLLAIAFSNAKIAIYSLPHPDALQALRKNEGGLDQDPLICQVQRVADLKLGSVQANHDDRSGQCFCVDWLPVKPHNILAAGFNDGTVALWNLSTKSLLQHVRSSSSHSTVYPYHCFIAHDSGVRVLSWCKASR